MTCDIGKCIEDVMSRNLERDALNVNGQTISYETLYSQADAISNTINQVLSNSNQFIGIFCYKSVEAYAGILGSLFSKNAYLPINLSLPPEKINKILSISECPLVILGEEGVDAFQKLNSGQKKLRVICPNPGKKINELAKNDINHTYIFPEDFSLKKIKKDCVRDQDPAYLMFTSGSTGEPKGIVVSHENLFSYAFYMIKKYEFTQEDRISQAPDISFDLSIQDLFSSFLCGGCLYVLPKEVMIAPHKYINDNQLTVWTSVPSVGIFMDNLGQLSSNSLPSLRLSLFCGEGLPCELASKWKKAAVNSKVINFYGPTEATVMFTSHEWDISNEDMNCFNGLVSIGKTFDHMQLKLIENGIEVDDGEIGEICISGSQVINGYFRDQNLTESKFIKLKDDNDNVWYRSGDLAKKSDHGEYFFAGRLDDQVQVRGHRVEMLEVDNALRKAVGHLMAVSLPVMEEGNNIVEDIVAFSEHAKNDLLELEILEKCKSILPDYMVPSKIFFIDKMPLNQNGKIDKKKLYNKIDMHNKEILQNDLEESIVMCNPDFQCSICLKKLDEDKKLDGLGLLKIINHNGEDDFICHTCLKGF